MGRLAERHCGERRAIIAKTASELLSEVKGICHAAAVARGHRFAAVSEAIGEHITEGVTSLKTGFVVSDKVQNPCRFGKSVPEGHSPEGTRRRLPVRFQEVVLGEEHR